MNHFVSAPEKPVIHKLIKSALAYKASPFSDSQLGAGKRLGLLFLNPSMRTRLSTQVAAANLGLQCIVFNISQEGWALEFGDHVVMNGTSVEHIKDAAPVLGQYFDILGIRTFPGLKDRNEDYAETILNQFIRYTGIPVISLESATLHPLQSLTDLVTITESFKERRKPKIVLTWAPHIKALPQCVSNSFAQWVNAWDEADFVITHPEGYELDQRFTKGATIVHDQTLALADADFVYVKNWSAYGDYGKMLTEDSSWMLNNQKLQATRSAKVMHCLPVRRNLELGEDVLDGSSSLVTREAGNRVWAAQAVIADILKTI